ADEDEEKPDGFAPTFVEKPRIFPNATGTVITMKCKVRHPMTLKWIGQDSEYLKRNENQIWQKLICRTIAPVIVEKPRIVRVVRKRVIIIECRVQAQAPPQITWVKDERTIREDSRRTVKISQVS
ncbi:unnamed protein product, partial [Cyprideis torosa]